MNLLDLLTAGDVEAFNAQRGERRRLDLFAADLAGAQLVGVDLSGAHLEKSDLTGADLSSANLVKADLSGIDGGDARLCDAMGVGMRLKGAWLEGADLTGADLSRADLSEAVLTRARGEGLRLVGAKLREADAGEVAWSGVALTEARLHKASLKQADLSGADLSDCTAQEADLSEARLDGATASRIRLQGAVLKGASLVGARLDEANLQGADLSGANLEGADLRRANLSGADLTGARLNGAVLAEVVLEGVDLAGLDLAGVDLTGLDPRLLGLSEQQLDQVAAVGVSADTSAPLRFADISVARAGDAVGLLWENADTDEKVTLRWALLTGEGVRHGVLPITAEGVLARAAIAAPDGLLLVVLQERPGGTGLLIWRLRDGEPGAPRAEVLGYDPGVQPVLRADGEGAFMWGLARRGPTLVVQRLDGEEVQVVHSEGIATARGFVAPHDPILACKGGVVLPVGRKGASAPLRTPSSFPGRLSAAAVVGDRVLAAWVAEAVGNDPGGLRVAWLEAGGSPRDKALSLSQDVVALDAYGTPEGAWIAWSESGPQVGSSQVWVGSLPDRPPRSLEVAADVEELHLVPLPGQPDVPPLLALVTFDEELLVLAANGELLWEIGNEG